MVSSRFIRATLAVTFVAVTTLLGAQQSVPTAPRTDAWTPFLGCWSTSSAGVVGPMVCVVPADSVHRVEFMTVDGDSIVARTVIDASGRSRAHVRGECAGWEDAKWSRDQRRLYMHASYRCRNGTMQRSDAIVSMTHADAFTQVERTISRDGAPARVVNFIVQLDTTVYPVEVRRRLGSYRPLAQDGAELETMVAVSASDVMDAATNLDPAVVEAWLDDRGEHPDVTSRELRVLRRAAEVSVRNPPLLFLDARGRIVSAIDHYPNAFWRFDAYRGEDFPTNIVVTPAMVNFGGSASGFPSERSVNFRWP